MLPPNGSFTPRAAQAGPATYVAFAAGCGITPVLSVTRALLAQPGSRVIVFYGNQLAMAQRTMCLRGAAGAEGPAILAQLALHFVMSREPQEVEIYNGKHRCGARALSSPSSLFEPAAVSEYFVCGPGDMIEQVTGALRELGVDGARVHAEHFTLATTAEGAAPPPPAVAPVASSPAAGFAEVNVLMDGRRRTFSMKMDDDTVLDAAARAGVELPFSCRAGVCSTCRTKVVRGEVAMDQNYALEDWELEQGYVLACQSRVKTPTLELDYDEK